MYADGAGLGEAVSAPYGVEKLFLADGFAPVLHEIAEQLEFLGIEPQLFSVTGDYTGIRIEGYAAAAYGTALCIGGFALYESLYLGGEHLYRKRLVDIVVGACFIAQQLAVLVGYGAHHKYGDITSAAYGGAGLVAVHTGEHNVQQHQSEILLIKQHKGFLGSFAKLYREALFNYEIMYELTELGIVFNNKNVGHRFSCPLVSIISSCLSL